MTKDYGDLFSGGKEGKREGMERVAAAADTEWKILMTQLVEQVARELRSFTTDDVFELFYRLKEQPRTHDHRAMGPIMLAAARNGTCRKGGWAYCRRGSRHHAPIQVWISLIYEGPTGVVA